MRLFCITLLLLLTTTGAEARHYRHGTHISPIHARAAAGLACWGYGCEAPQTAQTYQTAPRARISKARGVRYASYGGGQVVGHPSGCPRRLFCGCGAAVRVFGAPVRSLWLAAAWLRFPRSAPAPGMVAARRGHVFVLERPNGDGTWLVYDANSGGHATRVHTRSLAGYAIVNPRA